MKKHKSPQNKSEEYEKHLEEAIQLIHKGWSYSDVCRRFPDVRRSTLHDNVNGKTKKAATQGPECVLSNDIERRLVDWLIYNARIGNGKTRGQLLNKVQYIVKTMALTTPFKDGRPSKTWYASFRLRHKELSSRKPLPTSIDRAQVTVPAVRQWFPDCREYARKEGVGDIFTQPRRIINMDETGFRLVPKVPRVLRR